MRLSNVDISAKKAKIHYKNEEEAALIEECFENLIKKQERLAKRNPSEEEEVKKLHRYKLNYEIGVKNPKARAVRNKQIMQKVRNDKRQDLINRKGFSKELAASSEHDIYTFHDMEGADEVTKRTVFDIATAVNDTIADMEEKQEFDKDDETKQKYEKLKKILNDAQESKGNFERVTPKPRGFGHLRK